MRERVRLHYPQHLCWLSCLLGSRTADIKIRDSGARNLWKLANDSDSLLTSVRYKPGSPADRTGGVPVLTVSARSPFAAEADRSWLANTT